MDSRSKAIPLLTSRWNWTLPTSLSNYILNPKAKFLSALALATARETCVTAIATITTTVRKGVDVCGKNYRYLQVAREDERRLIKMQTLSTVLNQTLSSETSISTLGTREQSIAAVAALADVDLQDVLPIVPGLEGTERGVERFTQVQVPGYVGAFNRPWQRIVSLRFWAGALWTRVKIGLFFCLLWISFLLTGLDALMDYGIVRFMRRVLIVAMVYFSLRCLMEEG